MATVGVGQNMYQIREYTSVNNVGTAVLLEALIEKPASRPVVASSMSIYGEGLYKAPDGTTRVAADRHVGRLSAGDWAVRDAAGEELTPRRAYGIPTVAMRFFNVYGPHQALSNPYTGALAIYASSLLNDKPPVIFEDGFQQRDFVSVYDVARACRLALDLWSPGILELLARAGCVSVEAGVRIPFVQANLLEMEDDDTEAIEAWRGRLQEHGVWANKPVPLFVYPGSPEYTRRWGDADDQAWERAHAHYLEANSEFSDIQEQRPAPLVQLESGGRAR